MPIEDFWHAPRHYVAGAARAAVFLHLRISRRQFANRVRRRNARQWIVLFQLGQLLAKRLDFFLRGRGAFLWLRFLQSLNVRFDPGDLLVAPTLALLQFVGMNQRRELGLFAHLFGPGKWILRAGEKAVQRVIVLLRDGLVFMVVAAGAADRYTQHHRPERGQRVLDNQVHILQLARSDALGLGDETGRDNEPVVILLGCLAGQNVPRQLLVQKPVVRNVSVQRVDAIVAI